MLSSLKLVDIVEQNAEEVAKQWVKEVRKNPRTTGYHGLPEETLVSQAMIFYQSFRTLLMGKKASEEAHTFFSKYAEERYGQGITLHEAIYALVLMRRHMWIYADLQANFVSVVEHQQAIESISRTILLFDYASYMITQRYMELLQNDIDRKLGKR